MYLFSSAVQLVPGSERVGSGWPWRSSTWLAVSALVLVTACTSAEPADPTSSAPALLPPGFGGTSLAVLSDTDMTATAYTDGDLGEEAGADQLTVIPLTGEHTGAVSSAEVSNSVVAQPAALAVAPDGLLAVTAETTGPRSAEITTLKELPNGSRLTVTTLGPGAPKVVQTLTFPEHPETVDFSPDGRTLAVTFGPAEKRRLALVPVQGDRLGEPRYTGLPGIELPAEATRAAQVDWHPSSRFLAVTLPSLNKAAFFRVADDRRSVRPWGKPIEVGNNPFVGRFTPEGKHFVVTSTQWNLGVDAPPGRVSVTRFSTNRPAALRVVSEAEASYGSEGLTISLDGRWVVTSNIEFSANPVGDPGRTEYTSLSLFSLTPSGRIEHEDTVYDDAILTEAAVVDTTSTWVASTTFQQRQNLRSGGLKFWRIVDDRNSRGPKLVSTPYAVPLARGPHTMVLTP